MNSFQVHRRFETKMTIRVATYDIDYANHVSNIVYFRWLEDLRLQLLEKKLSSGRTDEPGLYAGIGFVIY